MDWEEVLEWEGGVYWEEFSSDRVEWRLEKYSMLGLMLGGTADGLCIY